MQGAPLEAESNSARMGDADFDLTIAEKDCVLTSRAEDVEDLSDFVTERLRCLSERSVKKFIEDESENVEEILCGRIGVGKDGGSYVESVCPDITFGGDVDADKRRFSPGQEVSQILREELVNANITSTPKTAAWPLYTKRRSSVLCEQDELPCKAVMFDVAGGSGTVGGREMPRGSAINGREGVPESFVTSGGFSSLEGIVRRQADERFVGARIDQEGEGMVCIPPVGQVVWARSHTEGEEKIITQSVGEKFAERFCKICPPTNLDPSYLTPSFNADQINQIAQTIGLDVTLASYTMLEDLLLKARGGSVAHPVRSGHPAGSSPFPSFAGSSMGNSVASRSVHSLPTITETEGNNVIVSGDVLDEPRSSIQADVRLAMGTEASEKPRTDSLKMLQQIKSSGMEKKSRLCKWSREGRLNALLPSPDDKGGYVFTEEMLEPTSFANVLGTGHEDPLENKYCFYCMLCRQNMSMRTRGFYELKRHFQRDCHFRADQWFRENYCPGKVRVRKGRVLYGSRLEAERDFYLELDVSHLHSERPSFYDVLGGKAFYIHSSRVLCADPNHFVLGHS